MRLAWQWLRSDADDDDDAVLGFCLGWYVSPLRPWLSLAVGSNRLTFGWLPSAVADEPADICPFCYDFAVVYQCVCGRRDE